MSIFLCTIGHYWTLYLHLHREGLDGFPSISEPTEEAAPSSLRKREGSGAGVTIYGLDTVSEICLFLTVLLMEQNRAFMLNIRALKDVLDGERQ